MQTPELHKQLGMKGEKVAEDYLRGLGWTILGHNVKAGASEIDLLGMDGATLVVVEVKTRTSGSLVSAVDAIRPSKKKALIRGAQQCWQVWAPEAEAVRFDLIAITAEGNDSFFIDHLTDAFRVA